MLAGRQVSSKIWQQCFNKLVLEPYNNIGHGSPSKSLFGLGVRLASYVVQTRFYLRNAKSAAVILLKPPFVLIKIFFSELEHWNRVFVCRALDAMEGVRSRLEVPMLSQPYIRAADDGTYELLVPFEMGTVHILPYCFHTADEAEKWVKSRKGREHLQKLSARYQALDNQTQQYA